MSLRKSPRKGQLQQEQSKIWNAADIGDGKGNDNGGFVYGDTAADAGPTEDDLIVAALGRAEPGSEVSRRLLLLSSRAEARGGGGRQMTASPR